MSDNKAAHIKHLDILLFSEMFSALTKEWDWQVEGFVDKKGTVYPIDLDTKVISTVFERLASPVLRSIAKEFGYSVETANQTTYPDFTLTEKNQGKRIAVDIKTTYFSPRMGFTLGGYNSFLRNDTKNILYPYSSYSEHWIIGFIYKQAAPFKEYDLTNMPRKGEIICPYTVESIFIRQKHEITGLRAGSGNTKNIGSVILAAPDEFKTHMGPFTRFKDAKSACDHFWRKYEDYISVIQNTETLLKHADFQAFGLEEK